LWFGKAIIRCEGGGRGGGSGGWEKGGGGGGGGNLVTALRCTGSLKRPFFCSARICVQRICTFLYMKQLYMQTEDGFHMSEHRTVG